MSSPHPPRSADEALLRLCELRCLGQSTAAIAKAQGVSQQLISEKTNAVRRADLAESGEPDGRVRKGYWG